MDGKTHAQRVSLGSLEKASEFRKLVDDLALGEELEYHGWVITRDTSVEWDENVGTTFIWFRGTNKSLYGREWSHSEITRLPDLSVWERPWKRQALGQGETHA